jgi:predicted Ser/Thr protein kinase
MVGDHDIGEGAVLGGFKIEKVLGKGGMGVVYKGHELSLNRKVALKVLSQRLCSDKEFIERFKREARVIAALNHPNIVHILSYGEEHGRYYFAMEYLSGKDLGRILKERRSIPVQEALSMASQIAGALSEAGSRGVVHRDLKPSNIMVDELGRVKVTDFGVAHFQDSGAKLTQTGLFLGTPEYASPEQATGRPLDVRSDIYALGAVLYRMLSGKPPITGESPLAVVTKIATEPVTPIGQVNTALPKRVCELIERMMAKEATDRFQTPEEVLTAIDRCIDSIDTMEGNVPSAKRRPAMAKPVPTSPPGRKFGAKFWGGVAGVALAVLLIVWLVEGGFLKQRETVEPKTSIDLPDQVSEEIPVESATAHVPAPAVPKGEADLQTAADEEKRPMAAAVASAPKKEVLPRVPTVLLVVSGDETMTSLTRGHLESIVMASGLRVASISEIPMLREKIQFGTTPITWHVIEPLIPKGKAHLLMLAEVQKTGSMPLKYYGRVQEMVTATFSVRSVDMASGVSVARPVSGSVKFTPLNMEKNLKDAIASTSSGIGPEMKAYWESIIHAQDLQ